jgi:predicted Zn-dependent peptidase
MQPVYASSRLSNGLLLGTAELPGRESAAAGVLASSGSRHEPEACGGLTHFVEHMVFKGTRRRSARRIALDIEGCGGDLNAHTSEDHTFYHATVPAIRLPRALDVLADLLLEARHAPADFRRERGVILEEIQMVKENPGQQIDDLLAEALWPEHPLGRPITGTRETLATITPEILRAWAAACHVADNCLLAVAGPMPHAEVRALAEAVLGAMPNGRPPRALPWRGRARKPRIRIDDRPLEQAHAALGFRTHGQRSAGRFALRLLSAVLGETMGSRLFQNLRERRGLCYSVSSEIDLFDDAGLLAITIALDPAALPAALAAIRTELAALAARAPGRAELARAREFLLGQQSLWFESTANQMQWVADCLRCHHRIIPPADARAALARVTADQVQAAAAACTPGMAALAIVGPAPEPAALAAALGWPGGPI